MTTYKMINPQNNLSHSVQIASAPSVDLTQKLVGRFLFYQRFQLPYIKFHRCVSFIILVCLKCLVVKSKFIYITF